MENLSAIICNLEEAYGVPAPRRGMTPLDVLVETILSQNTNDVNRDRAYTRLRRRYPSWERVMRAPREKIEEAIRVGGLARQKSERIQTILWEIRRCYGKLDLGFLCDLSVEEALEVLGPFKGVGPKTAHCVLLFGCGKPAFPVDTHIHRISRRLGLIPEGASPEKAHQLFAPVVPPDQAYSLHVNLIEHGRRTCRARQPLCSGCVLRRLCPSRDRFSAPAPGGRAAPHAPVHRPPSPDRSTSTVGRGRSPGGRRTG